MNFYRLEISADRMTARAVAVPNSVEKSFPARELTAALGRFGVRHGLIDSAIAKLMADDVAVSQGERVAVAEGQPPRAGKDGRLEWLVDVSSRPQYAQKADGSLDFRETNLVHAVQDGETLAVVHAPTEGAAGRNVLGETVPGKAGRPAHFALGANVALSPDGGQVVAVSAGRLIVDGSRISVEPGLSVAGDVDYSVGNVRFPGFLTVRGNVLDGFEVEAGKGMEIGGTAGACTLRSSGDIVVHGGVNGHGKAVLEAGGTVRVKYLNEAVVKARGDVEVATEVVNSRVYCLGRLLVRRGAMIGGEAVARLGVEAETLGSELGVQTRLTVGKDYDLAGRIDAHSARAAVIDAELPVLVKRLEALADRKKFLALPEAERERVKGDFERFKALKAERVAIEAELKGLTAQVHAPTEPPVVKVAKVLHQDVTVTGPGGSYMSVEVHRGPLALAEDRSTGRIGMKR